MKKIIYYYSELSLNIFFNLMILLIQWMIGFGFVFLFALFHEMGGMPGWMISILDGLLFVGLFYATFTVIKRIIYMGTLRDN